MLINQKRVLLLYISYVLRCSGHKRKIEPYVIEGELTHISHFPHAIYLVGFCDLKYVCGASVLNQKILLTAAHCTENCNLERHNLDVFAGSTVLEKAEVSRKVLHYKMHEDYNAAAISPNICLLVLDNQLPLGHNIKRVSISPWRSLYKFGIVAGWGVSEVSEEDEQDFTLLRKTALRILLWSECKLTDRLVREGMLCGKSGSDLEHSGPAAGDSGSALIVNKMYQIGILSFRADNRYAVVFTNVSYYKDWIGNNSAMLYCH